MARLPKFCWLFGPPLLLIAGWANDNIVPVLIAHFYLTDEQFAVYDLWNKWLLCGVAACIMARHRFRFRGGPDKAFLAMWLIVWALLLFEVCARFFGLFGWMGGSLRHRLYRDCYDCSASDNAWALVHWAVRPMLAFGLTYIACSWLARPFMPATPGSSKNENSNNS